jgi:hypothetical protein
MRRTRVFRPVAVEVLEERTVLSSFDVAVANMIGSVSMADTQKVNTAFGTFEQTYLHDVQTVLLPAGTKDPASNRAAFDTAVASALNTLNSAIGSAIKNLPSSSSLGATIQGELVGSGSSSLKSMLAALSTPTSTRKARAFIKAADQDIAQVANQVLPQVNAAPGPAGSIDVPTIEQDMSQIGTAFQTFFQSFNNSQKTILLPAGTTNPAANRSQFDQAVGTALTTLNSAITAALSNLPASVATSVAATVHNDLLASSPGTGTSLQEQLAAIASPTRAKGAAVNKFLRQSSLTMSNGYNNAAQHIISAIAQQNSTF